MGDYDRSTQYGDLKGAVDKLKERRVAPGMSKGRIAITAATVLGLVGSGGYALANRNVEPPEESIVQGQFIVRFDEEIDVTENDGSVVTGLDEVDALNRELEGETYRQLAPHSDEYEFDNFYLVDINDSLDLKEVMKDFSRADGVEWVGYNIKMGIPELMDATPGQYETDGGIEGKLPNDPYIHSSGSIPTNPDVDDMWGLLSTDAPKAWETQTGNEGIVFAVIDTGIADDHPDIKDNMWRNEAELNGIPGVDDDHNGYIDDIFGINTVEPNRTTYDGHGHGTHVSGTIAAVTDNGIGIAGINWNGQLMAVKVLTDDGRGDIFTITAGIVYAAKNGADVINMSLGGPAGPFMLPIDLAIRYATHKGVITVVAAGNSNTDARRSSPADHSQVITVAATGPDGNRAYFSNWGKKIDVGAPGMWILSTVPEVNKIPQDKYPIIDRIYSALHGTSMASPMTAGLVGLILDANPELRGEWKTVREIVRNAVDPYEKEQDKLIGKGIINYAKAVEAARSED